MMFFIFVIRLIIWLSITMATHFLEAFIKVLSYDGLVNYSKLIPLLN